MANVSFNRKRAKLKQVLGIRARLALLAVILVAPLMLDRIRSLEDTRAKQIAQATTEFGSSPVLIWTKSCGCLFWDSISLANA